jgi:hypothetical protein
MNNAARHAQHQLRIFFCIKLRRGGHPLFLFFFLGTSAEVAFFHFV